MKRIGLFVIVFSFFFCNSYAQKVVTYEFSEKLREVISAGQIVEAKEMVDSMKNINAFDDSYGWSALAVAIIENNAEMTKYIVDKGADPHRVNRMISVKKYGNPVIYQTDYDSAIKAAIGSVDIELFKYLYQLTEFSKDEINEAFVQVGWECNPKIMLFLLDHGADIDAINSLGFTALMLASPRKDSFECFKILIERGADIHIEYFPQNPEDRTQKKNAFFLAANSGNLKALKILVEKGADLNYRNEFGFNVLHLASKRGQLEVIRYLVKELGFDFKAKTKHGDIPYEVAEFYDQEEAMKLLKEFEEEEKKKAKQPKIWWMRILKGE